MSQKTLRGWLVLITLFACLAPVLAAPRNPREKTQFYKGQVIPLAEIVTKSGGKLDDDAAPFSLVLKTDDGKVYPLVKDDGSRMFFKDARLLRRPMRLTAQLVPGSQMLQVVEVHSYHNNQLHELYYWCDICAIRRLENKICDCCGAPMELVEKPLKP